MDIPNRAYIPQGRSTDWWTPPELLWSLDEEFGPFDCDPAATLDRACPATELIMSRAGYLTTTMGLTDPWGNGHERVFLNPPYGRGIRDWVAKAVSEVEKRNVVLVCALLPARADTQWWQEFVLKEVERSRMTAHPALYLLRFLPRRVRFVGALAGAPFPSAVVVWNQFLS